MARLVERGHEFLASGEDAVCVIKGDAPDLGEFEAPSDPLEQRMAQPLLEGADLA
ncbi:hypothetical protein ACS3SW_14765 [Roseobacteraceae bacterium S113]